MPFLPTKISGTHFSGKMVQHGYFFSIKIVMNYVLGDDFQGQLLSLNLMVGN